MTFKKTYISILIFLAACLVCQQGPATAANVPAKDGPKKEYKVLHVMSYHSPWRWTDGQHSGFRDALEDLNVEYRIFQMDTKRNSSEEWKAARGKEARDLIDSWKPDLVYTTDDDAQEYVTKHYVNKDIPFVFSGVNKDPGSHGFTGASNVTGVVEHEHFVESVRLLKEMIPSVRKIAVVLDDAPMWEPVRNRMKQKSAQLPEVELTTWDVIHTFEEYKKKIAEYHDRADAIALIGIFGFTDERGKNVPYQEVLRWTAENSRLPDFSFWIDRVYYGTLCAVNVSEYEQGLSAGRIAHGILAEGKRPSDFPMRPTMKGIPVVSLARANSLGIGIKSGILLSAEVVQKFDWEIK